MTTDWDKIESELLSNSIHVSCAYKEAMYFQKFGTKNVPKCDYSTVQNILNPCRSSCGAV